MTGTARINNGTTPQTPSAGYTTLFVDQADKQTKQIDDDGTVKSLVQAGGVGGLVFAPPGAVGENDFKVTEEGVLNDSIRIAAGTIDLILLGVVTEIVLSNDFIITHADGLQTSGVQKIIALPYESGDESFINTPAISLFVAPDNEVTISVVELSINILGRGTFDISTGTTQDYREGVELTKMFYVSGTNLIVSGRPWTVFDGGDADLSNILGNSTTDNGIEFDVALQQFNTTKNAINLRRAVAPVGRESVEQYATDDVFLGMWRDKAKTTRGLTIRGHVRGLVDAQGQVDYAPNTDLIAGGQYALWQDYIDVSDKNNPSAVATWTPKAASGDWSLVVIAYFPGSANPIMILGREAIDNTDIDAAEDQFFSIDVNERTRDVVIAGAFVVRGSAITTGRIQKVPASKILINQ
tara:strand:- start:36455 stop:37687 length:1233 start_codon:yes stop_codon:yes gene_type:complete